MSEKQNFIDADGNQGCIEYSVSTFGFMDYQEKSKYVIKMFDDIYGCEYTGPILENEQKQDKSHVTYLLKRGGCTYVQKAINVRRAGGNLALVYHDNDQENIHNVIPIAPKNISDNVPPIAVIGYADGIKLKNLYERNGSDPILLRIDFDIEENTDNKLKVKFWMSPTNPYSYEFLSEFSKYYRMMQDKVEIDVVYKIKTLFEIKPEVGNTLGNDMDPTKWVVKNKDDGPASLEAITEVTKFCYGRGKYCALNDANYLYDPKESLDQVIYQTCLFNQVKKIDHYEAYWQFVTSYRATCINPETAGRNQTSLNTCFKDLLKNLNYIDINNKSQHFNDEEIDECYESKFKNPKNKFSSKSQFFDDLVESTNLFGQNYEIVPSMFIDGHLVRGKLEAHTAVSAVCDAMKHKMSMCHDLHKLLKKEIAENYLIE